MSTLKQSKDALVGALTNLKSQMHTQNKSTAAGHTAGPWRVDNDDGHRIYVMAPNGITVCDCAFFSKSESAANARLIAAAPDLLAALEGVLYFAQMRREVPNDALIAATAALAKARV